MKKLNKGFDYSNMSDLLLGRDIIVGIEGGTSLGGEVRFIDDERIVLVTAPRSSLDIETQVVHNIIAIERVAFIQFKSEHVKE